MLTWLGERNASRYAVRHYAKVKPFFDALASERGIILDMDDSNANYQSTGWGSGFDAALTRQFGQWGIFSTANSGRGSRRDSAAGYATTAGATHGPYFDALIPRINDDGLYPFAMVPAALTGAGSNGLAYSTIGTTDPRLKLRMFESDGSTCPLKWSLQYGKFPTGTGAQFAVKARYGPGSYGVLLAQTDPIGADNADATYSTAWGEWTCTGTKTTLNTNGTEFYIVPTTPPLWFGYQCLENTAKTTGLAYQMIVAAGGRKLTDLDGYLTDFGPTPLALLLSSAARFLGPKKLILIKIGFGMNDRGVTDLPTYAASQLSIVAKWETAAALAGVKPYYLLRPSHPIGRLYPDGTWSGDSDEAYLAEFRDGSDEVARITPRCASLHMDRVLPWETIAGLESTATANGTIVGGSSIKVKFGGSKTDYSIRVRFGATGDGYATAATIAHNSTAADIQTAIAGLANVGAGNVLVEAAGTATYLIHFAESLGRAGVGVTSASGGTATYTTNGDSLFCQEQTSTWAGEISYSHLRSTQLPSTTDATAKNGYYKLADAAVSALVP